MIPMLVVMMHSTSYTGLSMAREPFCSGSKCGQILRNVTGTGVGRRESWGRQGARPWSGHGRNRTAAGLLRDDNGKEEQVVARIETLKRGVAAQGAWAGVRQASGATIEHAPTRRDPRLPATHMPEGRYEVGHHQLLCRHALVDVELQPLLREPVPGARQLPHARRQLEAHNVDVVHRVPARRLGLGVISTETDPAEHAGALSHLGGRSVCVWGGRGWARRVGRASCPAPRRTSQPK